MPFPVLYMVGGQFLNIRSNLWHLCLKYNLNLNTPVCRSNMQNKEVCWGFSREYQVIIILKSSYMSRLWNKKKKLELTWPLETWILKTVFISILIPKKNRYIRNLPHENTWISVFHKVLHHKSSSHWLGTSKTCMAPSPFVVYY